MDALDLVQCDHVLALFFEDSSLVVAGGKVKGHIVVNCTEPSELNSLRLTILGEETVHNRQASYTNTNVFLSLQPPISFGPTAQSGDNAFPFEAVIPPSICPSSFKQQSNNGRAVSIEYSAQAECILGSIKIKSNKILFRVLETFASKLHPVSAEDILQGFRLGNGASASVHLAQQAFAPGNTANVTTKIKSNKEVSHITIFLRENLSIREADSVFESSQPVARSLVHVGLPANTKKPIVSQLKIPEHVGTSVLGTLISLQHQIGVTIHLSGLIPQEFTILVPILLCDPTIMNELPKPNQDLIEEEFEVIPESQSRTELTGLRLLPKLPISGSVFYKVTSSMYCDIPDGVTKICVRFQCPKKITIRGRWKEEPTFFVNDIPARELTDGSLTISLDKYSSPPICSGRWFFSATGSSFMQTSNYQVLLLFPQDNQNENECTERLFEYQKRNSPFSDFDILGMDYPAWTTIDGTMAPCRYDILLPDELWYWSSRWTFGQAKSNRDAEGWQYASSWTSNQWKPQSNAMSRVRRRLWKRIRAIKPEGFDEAKFSCYDEDEELDDILDEFEVITDPSIPSPTPAEIFISPDVDYSSTSKQEELGEGEGEGEGKMEKEADRPREDLEISLSEGLNDVESITDGIPFIEDEELVYTEEQVNLMNQMESKTPQMSIEGKEAPTEEIQLILDQEEKERERKKQEELLFLKLEKEREERALQLQKKREEERKRMEDEWAQREVAVRKKLEGDQQKMDALENANPALHDQKIEISSTIVEETVAPIGASYVGDEDDDCDDLFEPVDE